MTLSNFLRFSLSFLGVGLSAVIAEDAFGAVPVTGVVLRADAGVGPGFFWSAVDGDGRHYDTTALTLAPTLGLNLGYAPTPGLRIGIGGTAQGTVTVATDDGIPATSLDSMMRWAVGPTIGFRGDDGLEFEFGLAATGLMFAGGQVAIDSPDNIYSMGTHQYGAIASGTAIWRPYGPRSRFGLFAGVNGGGALGDARYPLTTIMATSLLGVSFGL